jgi:hypothetical protein
MSIEAEGRPLAARCFAGEAAFDATEPEPRLLDFENRPVAAIVNVLAAGLMEILGPAFWATLILLFFYAELAGN